MQWVRTTCFFRTFERHAHEVWCKNQDLEISRAKFVESIKKVIILEENEDCREIFLEKHIEFLKVLKSIVFSDSFQIY